MPPKKIARSQEEGRAEWAPLNPTKDEDEDEVYRMPFPFNLNPFLNKLGHHFGYRFLFMLFAAQHLMKGFVFSFTDPASQYLYKSYNVLGPRMQIYGGITQLPWAMKPILGLMSDCFPIRGYRKGSYILIASIAGIIGCAALGYLGHDVLSIEVVVLCIFMLQFQLSTCDLLTEARYAEEMQSNPEVGPDLMTFVWGGLTAGGLVATAFVGPVLTHFGPQFVYLLSAFPAAFIIFPLARNYMGETPLHGGAHAESRREFLEKKEVVFLAVLMFFGIGVLMVTGIVFQSIYLNAFVAIGVAVVMLVAFQVLLRPIIAKVNTFFLLQTSMGVTIGGSAFYFYTDSPKAYPEGPHFSMWFYTTVLGLVGSGCSLIGIYSYQRWMKDWSYRNMLLFTNLAAAFLSSMDVIMFSRLNIKMGIPDHFCILGSSVIQSVIGQWMWMPGVVILAQLCPKGMEATIYALLAGCHNLGNTISSNCGALLLHLMGVEPSGEDKESAQFDNLWKCAIISTVLPTLTLVLIPYLIPDAKQTDKLLVGEDAQDACAGSMWRRWRGTD